MDKPDFRERFIDNIDEWDVQRENTSLDKNFKRDPYEYLRLHNTESTLLKMKNAQMFKKGEDGKYERLDLQSDGFGTLVLTTRRLTFSILSTRGSLSTFIPIAGRYNYLFKERDFIKYSIPSFLLSGTKIAGNFDAKFWSAESQILEWEIKNEGIKFQFYPEKEEKEILMNLNSYFELKTEYLITFMKSYHGDLNFCPGWNWVLDEDDMPITYIGLEEQDRKTLIKDLLRYYHYYWFLGEAKKKEYVDKIVEENKNIAFKVSYDVDGDDVDDLDLDNVDLDDVDAFYFSPFPDDKESLLKQSEIPNQVKNLSSKKIKEKSIETSKNVSSISDELEKLAELKEKGLLTDEEFSAAKAKLLDK